MLSLADIFAARSSIRDTTLRTPLIPSHFLTQIAGVDVLLKLETLQPTGAFKLRGAANAIFNLAESVTGVTCCSTGNHGRGVAHAARRRGLRAIICMSELVPETKRDGIRAHGGEVRIVGRSQDDAMAESERLCRDEGLTQISPFDDPLVIAGQGTIGLELLEDCPNLQSILVPLSGGGLAGGVALAAKAIKPDIRIIGLSMDRGAAMHASIAAGHPVEVEEVESLADSLGGGIGLDNKLSFQLCRELVDDIVLLSEAEIYRAMQVLYFEDRLIAEGASVVGVAALLSGKLADLDGPSAAIVTGRNVDMTQFTKVVTGQDVNLGNQTIRGAPYVA